MSALTILKWSGKNPPPAIGASVPTYVNNLGTGTVTGYFALGGYLGVVLTLDAPPDWYVQQNGGNVPAHLFGVELEPRRA